MLFSELATDLNQYKFIAGRRGRLMGSPESFTEGFNNEKAVAIERPLIHFVFVILGRVY